MPSHCAIARLILFLTLLSTTTLAQQKLPYFDPLAKDGIRLNPDINIEAFTYADYLNFLPKLMESDQFYRKQAQAMVEKENPAKYKQVVDRMERNDRVDEIILLKLLKKFGWPCSKNPEDSFTAWIVVWHASTHTRNEFYPYVKEALPKGCILKAHYDELIVR